MQWIIAGGAVLLLAIFTGRGGELANSLRLSPPRDTGGGGGGAAPSPVQVTPSYVNPAVTPSYSSQAAVATPSYAATPSAPAASGGVGYPSVQSPVYGGAPAPGPIVGTATFGGGGGVIPSVLTPQRSSGNQAV